MLVHSIWKNIVLLICGLAGGFAVAGGVFTVFTAVGLVPRFADRINAAGHILLFETMIMTGVLIGTLLSVYEPLAFSFRQWLGGFRIWQEGMWPTIVSLVQQIMVSGYALFTGCYVSCLALSIAEIFDAIPIMARRTGLKRGIGLVILVFALGKVIGSLVYYQQGFFE